MSNKHLSSQFGAELNHISTQIMEMGGLIESQMVLLISILNSLDREIADKVIAIEAKINAMEVEIDRNLVSMIARRQPTARDLRLLMAISKTTNNLERMGDEATKIAKMIISLTNNGVSKPLMAAKLKFMSSLAQDLVHKALDAFARLDVDTAIYIIRGDNEIDTEFGGFTRTLITYMMEDPRKISPSLDLLFAAKALERIGDHAKNIAELIIYIVKGEDVRHITMEEIESITKNKKD